MNFRRWVRASQIFGLVCAMFSANALAEQRVGLFRLDPLGVDAEIVERLEGLIRQELNRFVRATTTTKEDVEKMLLAHKSLRECTGDLSCLVNAARKLNLEQIISGNVGSLAENYVVNLKLVDVKTQRETRRTQKVFSGESDQLIETIREATYELVAPEKIQGALAVLASADGAKVFLNDNFLGQTPLPRQDRLPVGDYRLLVSKTGYDDVVQTIHVSFQKTTQVTVNLEQSRLGGGRRGTAAALERPVPWYTKWWFWTAVGIVATGVGVGLGFAFSNHKGVNCDVEPAVCGL